VSRGLRDRVLALAALPPSAWGEAALAAFEELIAGLEAGDLRPSEEGDEGWFGHAWVKAGLGFGVRLGRVIEAEVGPLRFLEIDTLQPRSLPASAGPLVRPGVHVGRGATLRARAFLDLGARVGDEAEVGPGAWVGPCVHVGRQATLGAGAVLAADLEPVAALSPVVCDGAWVGAGALLEGPVVLDRRAVVAPGTVVSASLPVFDLARRERLRRVPGGPLRFPERAVVLRGARRSSHPYAERAGLALEALVIAGYREDDEGPEEALLRLSAT
jgi:2,3,4,5-tetrahydropyridine-2-carboxylate N-succinyltransferase